MRNATCATMLLALLSWGCSDDEAAPTTPIETNGSGAGPTTSCAPGTRDVAGQCVEAGIQDDGCAAGQRYAADGCVPAGVDPQGCAAGFDHVDGGCRALLPSAVCAAGEMALAGEMACRALADCGSAPWGNVAVSNVTQYVDASYTVGDSDGSEGKPWPTAQEAIDASSDGGDVVIAEGSYVEDLIVVGKQLSISGRCPQLVSIAGNGIEPAALSIGIDADGSSVRTLSLTGATAGVLVSGATGVTLDAVRVHDTTGHGVDALLGAGAAATELTIRNSLIESTHERGIYFEGSAVTVDSSVVRDTLPLASGGTQARGINARDEPMTQTRSSLTLRNSIVARSREVAVMVHASDALIEASLVIDTLPSTADRFGRGMSLQRDPTSGARANVTIDQSVVENAVDGGIVISASDVTIDRTTVRKVDANVDAGIRGYGIAANHTREGGSSVVSVSSSLVEQAQETGLFITGSEVTVDGTIVRGSRPLDTGFGWGIAAQYDPESDDRADLTLRGSRIEQTYEVGILVEGSIARIEGTLVRDTTASTTNGLFGRGLVAQDEPQTGQRADVEVIASVFELGQEVGFYVSGSDAVVDATVVRDTRPKDDGQLGVGVDVEISPDTGERGLLTLRDSLVTQSSSVGVFVIGADALISHTAVRDTQTEPATGLYGDGVIALSFYGPASAVVQQSLVEGNARAGLSNFGGALEIANSSVQCNVVDLNGEQWEGGDFQFDDLGGNRCGCDDTERLCKVLSTSLTPPEPPERSDAM